jgi:hypothetical protein
MNEIERMPSYTTPFHKGRTSVRLGMAIATPVQPEFFKKKIIVIIIIIVINNFKSFYIHIYKKININNSLKFIIDDYKSLGTHILN